MWRAQSLTSTAAPAASHQGPCTAKSPVSRGGRWCTVSHSSRALEILLILVFLVVVFSVMFQARRNLLH